MAKAKTKTKNQPTQPKVIETKRVSISKKGIGMYTVKYSIGSKIYSTTSHNTEQGIKNFVPTLKNSFSKNRQLQFESKIESN